MFVQLHGKGASVLIKQVGKGVWEMEVAEGTHIISIVPSAKGMKSQGIPGVEVASGAIVEVVFDVSSP